MSVALLVALLVAVLCSGGLLEWGTRPAARRKDAHREHRQGNTLLVGLLLSCAAAAALALIMFGEVQP